MVPRASTPNEVPLITDFGTIERLLRKGSRQKINFFRDRSTCILGKPFRKAEEGVCKGEGNEKTTFRIMSASSTLNVKEACDRIRDRLRSSVSDVHVEGTVGKVTRSAGGHLYFELVGNTSERISCVKWGGCKSRSANNDGQDVPSGKVVVRVQKVDYYAPHGRCQAVITSMERQVCQEDWKSDKEVLLGTLQHEGLLDRVRKPLPSDVLHLCLVTSSGSAAYHDMMQTVRERWPGLRVTVVDTLVQGAGAPESIVRALRRARELSPCVIVCGRGGGSEADLSSFDDERVAREICKGDVPVVVAVGHESDRSICDAVADVRAKTPTAAVEIVLPDSLDARRSAVRCERDRVRRSLSQHIETSRKALSETRRRVGVSSSACFRSARGRTRAGKEALWKTCLPSLISKAGGRNEHARFKVASSLAKAVATQEASVREARRRVASTLKDVVSARKNDVEAARKAVLIGSPMDALERGYAIVSRVKDGARVRTGSDVVASDTIKIRVGKEVIVAVVQRATSALSQDVYSRITIA